MTPNNAPPKKVKIREEDGSDRLLTPGLPDYTRCDNTLITSKFTILNFLPLVSIWWLFFSRSRIAAHHGIWNCLAMLRTNFEEEMIGKCSARKGILTKQAQSAPSRSGMAMQAIFSVERMKK